MAKNMYEELLAAKNTHELARALLTLPPSPFGKEDRGERWAGLSNDADREPGIVEICLRNV